MNFNMIFDENNSNVSKLEKAIEEFDNQLVKAKNVNKILDDYTDVEQCEADIINSLSSSEIDEIASIKKEEIEEIILYLHDINCELKIKYIVIRQKFELINNILMYIQYLNNQADFNDELLNKLMKKIHGHPWSVIKSCPEPMKSFENLKDNKKHLFEIIWGLQKIRQLKCIYINVVGLIKLINCNYISRDGEKLEE